MKVLIVSAEVWRDDTNGGNVLSNIFKGTGFEFAQIFCNPGEPYNSLCKTYYQITDKMIINNVFRGTEVGQVLEYEDYPCLKSKIKAEQSNQRFYDFFRRYRFEVFNVARSILWKCGKWENHKLEQFIKEFNPDLIFAPCYASHSMLAIDRYVKGIANVPVVSYISDDNYGLRQFRLSPIYWIDRFLLRKHIRKTGKIFDLVYTMTDEQKAEYEKALNWEMAILRKSGDFSNTEPNLNSHKPIKMIYAGGLYCGRWKTLAQIANCLKIINANGIKMTLDIYTNNTLDQKQKDALNDGVNSKVHSSISFEELIKKYHESDIALHVESFEMKYKLLTRLSFSTKIIDCLMSGCAVMAICWKEHSGYKYLKKQDAALCVDSINGLDNLLTNIVDNPDLINNYAIKAIKCGKRNHQVEVIRQEFKDELEWIVKAQ